MFESPVEIFPCSYFERLPLRSTFARTGPLEVDIGCGDGAFLSASAARDAGRNFLGIERLLGRVRRTCRRVERMGLDNARILRIESSYAIRHLLPPDSVSVFHVAFPDPWPKRRHHCRRLICAEFLATIHIALEPDGELRVSTDDLPYFDYMKAVCADCEDFIHDPWTPAEDYPQTTFERHFRARGLPIYRLRLRKV